MTSGVYANSAFAAANTADQEATTSGVYANSAYSQANTATTNAATADQRAVTSGSYANSAFAAANTADQRSVTSGVYANAAYGVANTSTTYANQAFSLANSAYSLASAIAGNGSFTLSVLNEAFVGTGSCTTFQLSTLPANEDYTIITIEGVTQLKSSYSLSGANVVFSEAPKLNDNIDIVVFTGAPESNSAGVYANAAFALANAVSSGSVDAYARPHANAAFNTANSSSSYANGAFVAANTADQKAVTSGVYANAAFAAANTSDQKAVTSGSYANSAYSTANNKLNSTGGTISGDLSITGNLVVLGNATSIAVSSIKIDDSLIQLAANNDTSDTLDIGFIGHYSNDAGVNQRHTGLVRDATDGLYYLFYNYQDPSFDTLAPNNTIDVANSSFRIANLTANIITNVITVRGYDPIDHTNSAFAATNTADQKAVSAGVYANAAYTLANTVASGSVDGYARPHSNAAFDIANSASSYANGAFAAANNATDAWVRDAANSASSYANSGFSSANTADQKAVTSGVYANAAYGVANT